MKRIPFTIEAWKAGGVPVTRSGVYVKQLTWFEEAENDEYTLYGVVEENVYCWYKSGKFSHGTAENKYDIFLEVPCTKYYTHYYRDAQNDIYTVASKCPEPGFDNCIKTVEVDL